MRRLAALAVAICVGLVVTPGTGTAAPIQLALILDESGSIGATNFASMKSGIVSGLNAHIPLDGSVELTVVKFSNIAVPVIGPTLITNAAALAQVTNAITSTGYTGDWTNTAHGISLATQLVTNSPLFATASRQIFNIVTDGLPTAGGSNGVSHEQAGLNAAVAAMAAGIDELSAEGIALSTTGQNYLLDLVFPGNGYLAAPFLGPGFVYPVSNFNQAFAEAFAQKLQFVVTNNNPTPASTPEPMTLAVFGLGALAAGGLYHRRRKTLAA